MKETSNKIRVLIADDSIFIRKVLQDILSEDPEIEVAGLAKNGVEALEVAKWVNPDVITLDVEMPVMDGLTCLKLLLEQKSYPVVMISSATDEGTEATIEALEIGAVDFVKKPTNLFGLSVEDKKCEIIQKVKIAKTAALKNIREKADIKRKQYVVKKSSSIEKLIVIGTSTGGPRALQSVIPVLPRDIPAAVLIVQHMPHGFTRSMAARLNDLSELKVKEAEDHEKLMAGYAYVAPGDRHMLLVRHGNDYLVSLDDSAPVTGLRPCFDKTLFSMAETELPGIIAVVMTGMGSDGTKGLTLLKQKKDVKIIAQDEKSCIVYGMPRVVAEAGIADNIVPLEQIPDVILNYMGVQR